MTDVLYLSALAGLATLAGALLVLMVKSPGERTLAIFLGLAAGVMLGVVLLDLLPQAVLQGGLAVALQGFSLGVTLVFLLDRFFTSRVPWSRRQRQTGRYRHMGYLVAMGIALHDLPEGMAIAVGQAAANHLGVMLALAIGLHNIPEGMATATPLRMGNLSTGRIILINGLISLVTPLGAMLGVLVVGVNRNSIAWLLALAGGAMVYLVRFELWPESHRRHPNYARMGIALGLVLALGLGWLE